MTNSPLRDALRAAKMSPRELASVVNVDEKTVARWLSNEGRIPHPRHRWATAQALGVGETVLWPETIRTALKTGADREIVAAYPFRSATPKALWRDLIAGSRREITIAGYTSYFLWLDVPNLRATLRRKVEQGVVVRFLIGDPDSEVTRRREQIEAVPLTVSTRIKVTLDELSKLRADCPQVQARLSDQEKHVALSVFRFDDDALISVHIADLLGHDSPTLHLRRRQDDGLFDRFTHHVESLWNIARETD